MGSSSKHRTPSPPSYYKPAPAEIQYGNMRFLITDRPTDYTIAQYLEVSLIFLIDFWGIGLLALVFLASTRVCELIDFGLAAKKKQLFIDFYSPAMAGWCEIGRDPGFRLLISGADKHSYFASSG